MALREDAKIIAKEFQALTPMLEHNKALFEIYEGNLLAYVLKDLQEQLNERAFNQAKHRVAPINILQSVIDKLSRLYNEHTIRRFTGTPRDIEMLEWYDKCFQTTVKMAIANHYFNLFKNTAPEPYLDPKTMKPQLRTVPSDRFFVYSNDPINPMRMTHFVKIMGKRKLANGRDSIVLYIYTENEFIAADQDGEVIPEIMQSVDLQNSNPYGAIPFGYAVKSNDQIMPHPDTDALKMTKLVPILLTDVNYALMFQAFSIFYGINVSVENLEMNPNVFWNLKSDKETAAATGGVEPKVGMIKPEVDSDKVISLVQAELGMWLQSRNIRPGAVGQLTQENFASGVSKMVDEMDTTSERKKQVPYFINLEQDLWTLVIKHLHPVWSKTPGYEMRDQFSPQAEVQVIFPEQRPDKSYVQVLDEVEKEIKLGLISKRMALKKLNPYDTDEQIEERLEEIEEERTIELPEAENDSEEPEEITKEEDQEKESFEKT